CFRVPNTNLDIQILRGGFPINFDGSSTSVRNEDIQVTRGLLLGAVLQALSVAGRDAPPSMALDGELQRFVLEAWFSDQRSQRDRYPSSTLEMFGDAAALASASSGAHAQLSAEWPFG